MKGFKFVILAALVGWMSSVQASEHESDDQTAAPQAFKCSEIPRYCKEMESCEQAEFALEHCGQKKLDPDGDGVPCENVCG